MSDMVKYKLRVTIYEFWVTSCELRVESLKYELKFKDTSWNSNPRVTSSNPRFTSSNPRVTSLNPRVTSSNPRVTSSNPRAQESLND